MRKQTTKLQRNSIDASKIVIFSNKRTSTYNDVCYRHKADNRQTQRMLRIAERSIKRNIREYSLMDWKQNEEMTETSKVQKVVYCIHYRQLTRKWNNLIYSCKPVILVSGVPRSNRQELVYNMIIPFLSILYLFYFILYLFYH